jgi:hypothetical protein
MAALTHREPLPRPVLVLERRLLVRLGRPADPCRLLHRSPFVHVIPHAASVETAANERLTLLGVRR